MKKLSILAAILCLNFTLLYTQNRIFEPFSVNETKTAASEQSLKNSVEDAKIIDVNFNTVNSIISSGESSITVRLPFNGKNLLVKLERFEIFSGNSKIVEGTSRGDKLITDKPKYIAYTSNLQDRNSPLVTVTFFKDEVSALVISENETFVLAKRHNSTDHIAYQSSKLKIHNHFECRSDELGIPSRINEIQKNLSGNFNPSLTTTLLMADIAVESDFEFYTFFGNSVNRASNYIISLYIPVSAIYTRDANVRLRVTYLRVWSTSSDPYPDATSSNTLLNSFRSYWNSNMSSVQRTIAHFISTRPGGLGGIAWVDVLCANPVSGFGYAFSDIDGVFNQIPTYSWDVMVVAHETGHNFGSPHTHNCSWPGGPIDSCYTVEGGCYSGPQIARVGTIMSYCHLNGSIALLFGPLPSQLIRSRAETVACLTSMSGYFMAYPNGGQVFRSGATIPFMWGTSNTGNVDLQYSSDNGATWINVGTNIDATLRTYNWTVPYIPTSDQSKARVFQSGNTGTADESDSTFSIRPTITPFVLVNPPQLSRTTVSSGDTSKVHFNFSKAGTLPEFKYKVLLSTTNNANSVSLFSNNSGSDTVLSLTRHYLDSIVTSWGASNIGDSLRLRWNVKTYTVYDSLPSTNTFLVTFLRTVIGIQPLSSIIPDKYFVSPNYPNPFNPETKIKFGLPSNADVRISVFDILGREVDVIVNAKLDAGEYLASWNAVNFASGIYIYRIDAKDYRGSSFTETRRMVLVK